jgi:hypothetical protein
MKTVFKLICLVALLHAGLTSSAIEPTGESVEFNKVNVNEALKTTEADYFIYIKPEPRADYNSSAKGQVNQSAEFVLFNKAAKVDSKIVEMKNYSYIRSDRVDTWKKDE